MKQETKEATIEKKATQEMEFKAETKKLLDIVAKSLYTDKEVFLRELLSNSSDALEKQRYLQLTGKDSGLGDPLQISVIGNESKRQIIIQDSGVGMTKEELIENLGTIAKSGSKAFIEKIKNEESGAVSENIIGQFGVGFYSAFIVGDTVEVISKSSLDPNQPAHMWVSDGNGKFEISEISDPGFTRGTKITIHLKPENAHFAKKSEIQKIIEKYSNFINYPINLNGEKVNLVSAIWTKDKRELTENDYKKFWEYIANTKVDYRYKLHFSTDAPLSIKSILFIPNTHAEQFGMSMEEMEVHLYSRKVLIKSKCRELLPNWLRFVKGVVDCEDIPLNISREQYQDSSLMIKLRSLLTKRIIKLLDEQSKKDEEGYLTWYNAFHLFLKEGMATDQENAEQILQLLRYQANFTEKQINIEDYLKQMKTGQNKIYYILGPNKEACERSPYMEPFKGTDIPVLFVYLHVDEMVFRGLGKYKNMELVNIETNYEDISKDIKQTEHDKEKGLPEEDVTTFCLWVKNELQPVVSKVQISKRLRDSPAIIVSQWSSGMRQVMSMMDKSQGLDMMKNLTFEINPNHELITKLNRIRKIDTQFASMMVKQLLDNTMISSGMLQDPKPFIDRIYKIMNHAMDGKEKAQSKIAEPVREEAEDEESILKKSK